MEAFLAASARHVSSPSVSVGAPLLSAQQLPPRANPNAAVVVGTWAVVGAAAAMTQTKRGRSARRATEDAETAAFDMWNPSTYGNISMDDVKKYGAAGTLSYVITELIFWAVAFPTEVVIYLQTAGHWPDFSKPEESAAVFGMVFAASNVARLLLPIRFGAALALAPWVDENIMQRFSGQKQEEQFAVVTNAAADLRVEAARAQLNSDTAFSASPAISDAAQRRVEAARRELEARKPVATSEFQSSATNLRDLLMEVR